VRYLRVIHPIVMRVSKLLIVVGSRRVLRIAVLELVRCLIELRQLKLIQVIVRRTRRRRYHHTLVLIETLLVRSGGVQLLVHVQERIIERLLVYLGVDKGGGG
jgi:hypothetical protein